MEIKCLTNAGAWLKFKDTNILIDPWINDGKLGGALHTLPPLEVADIEILKASSLMLFLLATLTKTTLI